MQYNPNAKTLEGVIRDAIHRAGGISDENATDFNKVRILSTSRMPFPRYTAEGTAAQLFMRTAVAY